MDSSSSLYGGGWAGRNATSPVPQHHSHHHSAAAASPSPSVLAASGAIALGADDGTGTAWQQNRCLLCLLYEEKIRVHQRKNEELQSKLDQLQKGGGVAASSEDKNDGGKSKNQLHVTHSTVVPSDMHKFIEIVAERDSVIAEREKDLQHLAIDRDNVRSALDDTQEQLELLKRRIRHLDKSNARRARIRAKKNLSVEESGTDPEEEEERERERLRREEKKKKKQKEQEQQQADRDNEKKGDDELSSDDDYDYLGLGLSVASVAAARRARNAAAVRLGPHERLRPIHTEGALGILNNMPAAKQQQQEGEEGDHHHHQQHHHDHPDHHVSRHFTGNMSSSPVPSTLAGVSPLPRMNSAARTASSSMNNTTMQPHHPSPVPVSSTSASPGAAAFAGWSLREYEHLGPNSKHRSSARRGTTDGSGKLTRNVADDELGWGGGDPDRLPPSPSSLDRLRPLPAAGSLRSMSLAEPSVQTWRKGGKPPSTPDFRAPGTTPQPQESGESPVDTNAEFNSRSPHFSTFGPK